jgi:hypothetical protein
MSNGVNNSNNSRKNALNKTKITNVSYLKKNELSKYEESHNVNTLNSK